MSNSVCHSEATICLGGHFKWLQNDFSPVLSPYKSEKSKCQVSGVPNEFLSCEVVSRHYPSLIFSIWIEF